MILTRFILRTFAGCVCFTVTAALSFGQRPTAREESDYRGPVSVVTIRSVKYSKSEGKIAKTKKLLRSIERFDSRGNLLRKLEYGDDGVFNWDERSIFRHGRVIGWKVSAGPKDDFSSFLYRFDRKGNVIEQNSYDKMGNLSIYTKYEYDGRNREIERVSGIVGSTEAQKVRKSSYDSMSRQKEVSTFLKTSEGLVPHNDTSYYRRVLHYGNEKRWNSAESFSADEKLVSITKLNRDKYGNETEDDAFDGSGHVLSKTRYRYLYDHRGNWVVEKSYRLKVEDGTDSYDLDEVTYRKFQYFR